MRGAGLRHTVGLSRHHTVGAVGHLLLLHLHLLHLHLLLSLLLVHCLPLMLHLCLLLHDFPLSLRLGDHLRCLDKLGVIGRNTLLLHLLIFLHGVSTGSNRSIVLYSRREKGDAHMVKLLHLLGAHPRRAGRPRVLDRGRHLNTSHDMSAVRSGGATKSQFNYVAPLLCEHIWVAVAEVEPRGGMSMVVVVVVANRAGKRVAAGSVSVLDTK